MISKRAVSSVGRAPVLQTGGRRFESYTAHHTSLKASYGTAIFAYPGLPPWKKLSIAKANLEIFLGSSVVEQTTVNRWVAGSNPARGAIPFLPLKIKIRGCSSVWLERPPVTRKVVGSSPISPAIFYLKMVG